LDTLDGYQGLTNCTSQGQEAIEILRDPSQRYKYDKELEAHSSHPWVSSTGDHPPPQTSSVDSQSMNSHYHHRNWTGHQNRQNGAKYGGRSEISSGRYRSEAEMEMIFETVRRHERARTEALRQRHAERLKLSQKPSDKMPSRTFTDGEMILTHTLISKVKSRKMSHTRRRSELKPAVTCGIRRPALTKQAKGVR
jgi:curved DNA-binding protein CbpA